MNAPNEECPSCLQTTWASALPHPLSQIVPHVPPRHISTLPSLDVLPPLRRISPSTTQFRTWMKGKYHINIDTDEYSGMFLIVIAWIRNERVSTWTPQTSIGRMVTVVDTNPTVSTVNKSWFSPVAVEVIQKYSSSSSAKAGKTVGCGTCTGTCQQG